MPDILHTFTNNAPQHKVFEVISTPSGLEKWWTEHSHGTPGENAIYELHFGTGYAWKGRITKYEPDKLFELTLSDADSDWKGSRVGFTLSEHSGVTSVEFYHKGWPENNEHYRISCYCWAMYLRIMKRFIEHGEFVSYQDRLNV